MYLLLGPTSSGKTLLSKKLKTYDDVKDEDIPSTLPTIGTNLVNLTLSKRQEITLRELGGSMSPIWPNYLKECQFLIYVIDMSNRLQVSAACMLFLTILTNPNLKDCQVLVLLNKIDLTTCMSRHEFESLFRWDDILKHSPHQITLKEVSAVSGKGLSDILEWLQQHSR
ncbi:ADP-ribosylation factor-like protein 16 [Crassostrea virginica]|uniref:ADP-ribosylation factor-like protein 16 n=1 Tax=Crassostrea virginica TaxID=6565 RepID=A0A8B8CDJ7_CRAVI|nr:ADP-ribosylation factor-like protein 16 [Crassostrea virginica]